VERSDFPFYLDEPVAWSQWLLAGAWVAFGITIALMLSNMIVSQFAYRKQVRILINHLTDTKAPAKNTLTKFVLGINILSIILFIAGLALLGSYSVVNITNGTS